MDCAERDLIMVVSCRQDHCDDGFNVRYVSTGLPCDSLPVVSSQPDWVRQLCPAILKAKGIVDVTGIYEFQSDEWCEFGALKGLSRSSSTKDFLQKENRTVTDRDGKTVVEVTKYVSHVRVVSGKTGRSDLTDYKARWKWKCRFEFFFYYLGIVGPPILFLTVEAMTLIWFFRGWRSRVKPLMTAFAPLLVQVLILAFILQLKSLFFLSRYIRVSHPLAEAMLPLVVRVIIVGWLIETGYLCWRIFRKYKPAREH